MTIKPIHILIFLILLSISSCIPQKKLRYLQQQEESIIDTTKADEIDKTYILKSGDELYIKVNSVDPQTYSFFNGGETNNYQFNSSMGLYLNSYTISDSGFVQLPVAGKIEVVGLDLEEARYKVEAVLSKYLNDVSVTLKLSAFRLTILGEVRRPGKYAPYLSQLNIMEALALAGDMTPYGNRTRIMIIREVDGKEQVHFINLLDENILQSQDFNLLPNDIVYVESLNAKTWGFEHFPYALVLSSITTFILIMTYIRTI